MPYSSNQELPKGVKGNLPEEAQSIWRKIFNSAYDQYHDDSKAAATAWAGLKRAGYKQDKEGDWIKKMEDNKLMKLFLPITKVDETTRTIYMTAASESLDKSGEIMDYEKSKPNFEKWSMDNYSRSEGKSYGNIREMHTSLAAGKIVEPLSFDDRNKRVDIVVKVVDDGTWRKVEEGVLTGASIGGRYADRKYDPNMNAYKYTAELSEISLVDNPCNRDATFQLIKADGSIEERKFGVALDPTLETSYNEMEKTASEEDADLNKEVTMSELVKEVLAELEKKFDLKAKKEESKEHETGESKEFEAGEQEEVKKAEEKGETKEHEAKESKEFEAGEKEKMHKSEAESFMEKADSDTKKQVFHKIKESGAACNCEQCKQHEVHKVDNGELQKLHTEKDDMIKRFDALQAENDDLKKSIKVLEEQPMNAPVLNAQAVSKGMIEDDLKKSEIDNRVDVLKKMRDNETNMMVKDAIGQQLAAIEMQKSFANPINFTK